MSEIFQKRPRDVGAGWQSVQQPAAAFKEGGRLLVLRQGFTPAGLGADAVELTVPRDSKGNVVVWPILRASLRVAVAGGGESINIERSSAVGAFAADLVTILTLAAGASEIGKTPAGAIVRSGDKLRMNVLVVGTATGWNVQVELGIPS